MSPTKQARGTPPRVNRVALAFGKALQQARANAGLTQEELAELSETDRTYPSLLERGLRTPTLAIILRYASALGIAPGELVAAAQNNLEDKPQSYKTWCRF